MNWPILAGKKRFNSVYSIDVENVVLETIAFMCIVLAKSVSTRSKQSVPLQLDGLESAHLGFGDSRCLAFLYPYLRH